MKATAAAAPLRGHAAATHRSTRRPAIGGASSDATPRTAPRPVDASPRVLAQRAQIDAAFGAAIQRAASVARAGRLTIGAVDDPLEHEAELVAESVVGALPGNHTPLRPRAVGSPGIVRFAGSAPTANAGGGSLDAETTRRIEGEAGLGEPLEAAVGDSLRHAFGGSVDEVSIHRDSPLATQLGAVAFTHGHDIYFASGAYPPRNAAGLRLLAHELTHVVQQGAARRGDPIGAVVRRLPTRAEITQELGAPKRDISIGPLKKQQSTEYKAVLDAIDALHLVLDETLGADRVAIATQIQALFRAFDAVILASQGAVDGAGQEAAYMARLKLEAQNEKTMAIAPLMRAAENRARYLPGAKVGEVVLPAEPLVMDEGRHVGQVGGGMNTLEHYSASGVGRNRFFKPNMASMDVFPNVDAALRAHPGMSIPVGPALDAAMPAYNAKENRTDFADKGGISASDTRSAGREVASYRLDQLLDTDIIARAQFALRAVGAVSTLGSSQRQAAGAAAGIRPAARDAVDRAALGPTAFSVEDPVLMRLLSRLQLLDTLALQLDRHTGNFFLAVDAAGNVTGLSGIDNDMSFGTGTEVHKRIKQYSGMSRFVDFDLAHRILVLDPALVRLAMTDLLNPAELDALITRLNRLKAHLADPGTRLLRPHEWDQVVAHGLGVEQHGYQYTLSQKANNPGRGY